MRGRSAAACVLAGRGGCGRQRCKQQAKWCEKTEHRGTHRVEGMVARRAGAYRLRDPIMSRMNATAGTHRNFALAACILALPASAATLDEVIVTATRSPVALASYPGSATRIAADVVGARRRDALVGARQSRRGRDDPARQRAGIAHGAALAGADGRRRLRRGARARGRHPDPSGRHLQRQRALRGEPRAGGRDRGPARARQRPVRLERGARDHQRHPADAGRDPGFGVALEGGSDAWRRVRLAASRDGEDGGLGPRHARDRRRRLARRLGLRGAEAERRVGAARPAPAR